MIAQATAGPEPLLEALALSHRYGERRALDGVSLRLEPGAVVALLGPNGAGKSTLLRALCGLLRPDQGRVIAAPGAAVGWCPQHMALWDDLTPREQLDFLGAAWRLPRADRRRRADALLDALGLLDRADDLASALSGGMRRRLAVALALIHSPRVLLLDEPEVGLDPASRASLRAFLADFARQGRAVLLSTHDLHEAERSARELLILDQGRLLDRGAPAALIARHLDGAHLATLTLPAPPTDAQRDALHSAIPSLRWPTPDTLEVALHDPAPLWAALARLQLHPLRAELRPPSLEAAYAALTRRRWQP
jgi:ABC-2 type transport system ATP-binding protein